MGMTEEEKQNLRNHWIPRVLRIAREAYELDRDPLYPILDAACLAVPLFQNEPYFQRPTPLKPVGGVIRYRPGTKDKVLITNVFDPNAQTVTRIIVCEVAELVDNLGALIEAAGLDQREAAQLLDKVRRWVTHDDTLDELPDAESWERSRKARRLAAKNKVLDKPN